jgi:hypothetical protein
MSQGLCAYLSTPSSYVGVSDTKKQRREATARLRNREVKGQLQEAAMPAESFYSPEGSEPVLLNEDAYSDVDVDAWCW